jgi:hypothetical protein
MSIEKMLLEKTGGSIPLLIKYLVEENGQANILASIGGTLHPNYDLTLLYRRSNEQEGQ